ARDVDEAHLFAARQLEPGEPEIDRHAALLLVLEAVRVDARECLDQRRLAMVNVPGRAYNAHGVWPLRWPRLATASRSWAASVASSCARTVRRSSTTRSCSI